MSRRILMLLLFAGAGVAGDKTYKLKELLDPGLKGFGLSPYTWDEWPDVSKEEKLKAKGGDPAEWEEPPPEPLDPEEEKKKKEEEEKKKKEAEEKRKKNPNARPPRLAGYPGFHFDTRLKRKQEAFEELLQPASASKLEGLVKQLKLFDKSMVKFEKAVDKAREEYEQISEQQAKASSLYIKAYKKKHGKHPSTTPTISGFNQRLSRMQRLVALRQSELQFRDWILFRLGQLVGELTDEEATKPLAALAKGVANKDWRYRLRCAELLARIPAKRAAELYQEAMEKEQDPMLLAELVRIRAQRGGDGLFELLAKRLDDESWPVRAAVIRELARVRKKESIDLLVARLAKEDGRLKDDITDALKALTGKSFQPEPDPWRIWWEKSREKWVPPVKPTAGDKPAEGQQAGVVYFYGIQTSSKRVVFCVDISGSMEFPLDGMNGKGAPRIEKAKKELFQALAGLPEDALFSIVVYSAAVKSWKRKMQPATLKNKQAARKFVERLKCEGSTNIYDALIESMSIAATVGKTKGKDPEADTIFFLTDGIPTNGKLIEPHQILDDVTRRNKVLGVVIHTVGVSKEQNAGFLLNLAKKNGGRYVAHK